MTTIAAPLAQIDGIDFSDDVIHVVVEGTSPRRAYCGVEAHDHIPPQEVTDAAWCPTCVRIQDGTP